MVNIVRVCEPINEKIFVCDCMQVNLEEKSESLSLRTFGEATFLDSGFG